MSYNKIDTPPFDPADTLAELMGQCKISVDGIATELSQAGAFVTLDTGEVVWVGCVLHDDPNTPVIEFLAATFACDGSGPKRKGNGQIIGVANWRNVQPELVNLWGVPLIRKAAMMVALGEPQPQVDIVNPLQDGPATHDLFMLPDIDKSAASIRTAISTATQIAQALTDVL